MTQPEIRVRPSADDIPADAERLWKPQPKQKAFLERREFEVLFGGAAGPGKTDAIIYGGLRDVHHPDYKAAIFRREYPRLQELMDRAHDKFKRFGAVWNEQKKRWTFPSGAKFGFYHCQQEKDRFNYNTTEWQYLGFDQLEEFTETIYTHLITRVRSAVPGRRKRVRASANPGNEGHLFVMKRWRIDRHPNGCAFIDPDTGLSRCFIPARVWDNKYIIKNDPQYIQRLLAIPDPALRAAYLGGDWSVFAGQYFSIWNHDAHTCEPFELPEWWEREAAMDYGYSPSPSVILFGAFNQFGMAHPYREITLERATARQIAHAIEACAETPRERAMTIRGDTQMWTPEAELGGVSIAQMINDELAELGTSISLTQANKDRINGWARVFEFMDPRRPHPQTKRAQPWLRIFRHNTGSRFGCPKLIETIPVQIHDEKKPGDMKKNPTDHWVETLRYLLSAREPLALIPLDLMPVPSHRERIHSKTRKILQAAIKRARAEDQAEVLDMAVEFDESFDSDDLAGITTIGPDVWT